MDMKRIQVIFLKYENTITKRYILQSSEVLEKELAQVVLFFLGVMEYAPLLFLYINYVLLLVKCFSIWIHLLKFLIYESIIKRQNIWFMQIMSNL